MRKRRIKKTGNSYYVKLEQTDMKDLNLNVGDYIEVSKIMNFDTPVHETDILENCSQNLKDASSGEKNG